MKFIDKYGFLIFLGVIGIVFLVAFGIPLAIKVAKDMWQWALS